MKTLREGLFEVDQIAHQVATGERRYSTAQLEAMSPREFQEAWNRLPKDSGRSEQKTVSTSGGNGPVRKFVVRER